MKVIIIATLLALQVGRLQAQTFGEWFNQKKTQTKYLIEQIAALEVYLDDLKKGYSVVHGGLSTIGDIKNGELNLHTAYFSSLKTVNPAIMKYGKVSGILSMQAAMLEDYRQSFDKIRQSGQFSADEMSTVKKVYDDLMDKGDKDLDELKSVITSGELQMTDDARIAAIDRIYRQTQDKQAFMGNFSNWMLQVAAARQQGKADLQRLETLYKQ